MGVLDGKGVLGEREWEAGRDGFLELELDGGSGGLGLPWL